MVRCLIIIKILIISVVSLLLGNLSFGTEHASIPCASGQNSKIIKHLNEFKPPPIPVVNTSAFKEFVRKYHTFPSPFGYEPYRDNNGNPISFLLSELNPRNPYIPVTFICNSHASCPRAVLVSNEKVIMKAHDSNFTLSFGVKDSAYKPPAMIGFYFPNDPNYYTTARSHFIGDIKFGDPIVTILFSQRVLQQISDKSRGFIEVSFKSTQRKQAFDRIISPFADGNEKLSTGTTLTVIGLGQASGMEFTETISQTTGETYTKQVQTGFSLNLNIQYEVMLGGGFFPVSEQVRLGVNKTLTSLIGNELAINNQSTVTRSYTIKPGINDTYYWAIYQLGYSYRVNAPFFKRVLNEIQKKWDDRIHMTIADNQLTQDNKPVGNILPPQRSGIRNDITVGVAVPMNFNNDKEIFTKMYSMANN